MNGPLPLQINPMPTKPRPSSASGAVQSSPETQAAEAKEREERENMNSLYRKKWDAVMEVNGYSTSSSYRKVAILMISWHHDFDDLHTADEVRSSQSNTCMR
jgi:hypothetical protein